MSRGNLIQGQASGKLGSTVLMVRNGQQLARVYTTAGARSGDQASESARIQRVKFGSASNQWGLYKYVCTRMYRKGRTSSQSDYNYFVKRNAPLLPYFTKLENADGVHVLMPGQFSEGNLGRIELLHIYNATFSEEVVAFQVKGVGVADQTPVQWTGTISGLKAGLKKVFPAASKVTYLMSVAAEVQITEEEQSFVSQNINHYTVTIDLYKEATPGENSKTVAVYFSERVADAKLKSIISSQSAGMFTSGNLISMRGTNQADVTYLGKLGVLVFATDDNASDCYTTILPAENVPPTSGVYATWSAYRTASSLRIAADSYGYQAGVMRDSIAAYGNELQEQVQAYATRLAAIDSDAAAVFVKELEAAGGAKARTVRQAAPAEEK